MMQSLPVLNHRFQSLETYQRRIGDEYGLLPFRFIALDENRVVLTNFCGEHLVLDRDDLRKFVRHELTPVSPLYDELKSRHFLIDGDSTVALDLLAVKYRTKQSFLSRGPGLFLFVVTLRCDHSCPYCQVSRQSADRHAFDMTTETADRAIAMMFRSPAPALKVEFQGGEPLLNVSLIKYVVEQVEIRNRLAGKDLQFVIATNLAFLTDDILEFSRQHNIFFSTSLDGPEELHNQNRPRPGMKSYDLTISGIRRIRAFLGVDKVSALMTTTEASLPRVREIIDEYVRQEFLSIFLRPISPYGFAVKTGMAARYETERWLQFYFEGLDDIIQRNLAGVRFVEEYAALILRKALTPFATGYVDLQSPAGIGIGALVFNYDGAIYASDESRMLAETGDFTFRLGHLETHAYEDVMRSERLLDPLIASMSESVPMCHDCGFQPYCGSDPVYHHATQGDVVGFKPSSGFCGKNMGIMKHLFRLLEDDAEAAAVLKSWI